MTDLPSQLELAARILREPGLEWERRWNFPHVLDWGATPTDALSLRELLPALVNGAIEIRLRPWQLTRHLPGFRELREGEEWHREHGWTQEMLAGGYRPCIVGERGVPFEYSKHGDFWGRGCHEADGPTPKTSDGDGWNCFWRTKEPLPEPPRLVPWSFETRPREMVWVYKKGYITDRLVTAWRDDGVEIGSYDKCSYSDLLEKWVQRGGAPCGREETP